LLESVQVREVATTAFGYTYIRWQVLAIAALQEVWLDCTWYFVCGLVINLHYGMEHSEPVLVIRPL